MNGQPRNPTVHIRKATVDDLEAINQLIGRAIATWTLSDRVKRLSLPSYLYDAIDFDHLDVALVEEGGTVLAVATHQSADPADLPEGKTGLLLHGLYVTPDAWGRGLGRMLLQDCARAAQQQRLNGVLVKASRDSQGFFTHLGLRQLPVSDPRRDYARRYWLEVAQ